MALRRASALAAAVDMGVVGVVVVVDEEEKE